MATKGKEEFITIKHKVKGKGEDGTPIRKDGKFVWEEKQIKYRIDPDFIPTKIEEICEDFIQNYCDANNEGDWLEDQYTQKETKKIKDKNTKEIISETEQDKSFVSIRSAFAKKFFPQIVKGSSNSKETKREAWLNKRKAQK